MDQQQVIRRCDCSGLTFAQMKRKADEMNIRSIKGLRSRLGMGYYCTACVPYLKEMLRSGQTEFDQPIDEF